MKITKLGHCCLVIEDKGKRILTDPGAWTTEQNQITGIDLIVITHEHADHFHLESLKQVLKNNQDATIVTNGAVGKLLEAESIPSKLLEDQQKETIEGFELAAFGTDHAEIHSKMPVVMNTGYLFENKFFYPGDALTNPGVAVQILAMPMIGPWMKLGEAIDWATEIKPEVCIPVHDGMLNPRQWIYNYPTKILGEEGIKLDAIEPGESREY
ncbi:MAG: MBL fold metallo-hydrolase [Candidatus Andersenbacteria bacterium]